MPFIVRWPGQVEAGSISDQMICFTDVLATFAEMIGRELPNETARDSFSFLPVLRGEQPKDKPTRPYLPIASGSGMMTIRGGSWKLMTGLGSGGFSRPRAVQPQPGEPPMQLYDLSQDRSETTNVYARYPEIVKELLAELKRVRAH
jgi:arylsulfatase A-like enzyme